MTDFDLDAAMELASLLPLYGHMRSAQTLASACNEVKRLRAERDAANTKIERLVEAARTAATLVTSDAVAERAPDALARSAARVLEAVERTALADAGKEQL